MTIQPAIPEVIVVLFACVGLLATVLTPREKQVPYYAVQVALIMAAALWWYHGLPQDPVYAFHHGFVLDKLAVVLKVFVCLMGFFVFWYSRNYLSERRIPRAEYYVLGLLSIFGTLVLISGHNMLTIYLGLEIMSLPIYAMVALQHEVNRCVEASMKYFVIGALASGLLLYGMSLIFGATAALDLSDIAKAMQHLPQGEGTLVTFGLVFILAGVAFKLGAAPFHMWVPDVYEGAPSTVTLLIATVPKVAAFALAIRLLVDALPALAVQWHEILVVVAILSIAIGNFVAIMQSNIKRMLAYSSIAHMGYLLLGLICNTPIGDSAALFYVLSYTMMTMAAFALIIVMSKSGYEADHIQDFAGLNSRNPWLAFVMLLIMFSMAGIPPIVGFMAKVGILEALIEVHEVWLAVVALLFAIIGAYYYIRVVKVMYFEEPKQVVPVHYSKDLVVILGVNGVAVLLLGIFPGVLFSLCQMVF